METKLDSKYTNLNFSQGHLTDHFLFFFADNIEKLIYLQEITLSGNK